jgi:hypothetical protein
LIETTWDLETARTHAERIESPEEGGWERIGDLCSSSALWVELQQQQQQEEEFGFVGGTESLF